MEQPLQDREYLLLSTRWIVWRVRLFPLLPASQESGAQSQQDFIDEGNEVRDEEVQNEQDGGNGEQCREAQPCQVGNQRRDDELVHGFPVL